MNASTGPRVLRWLAAGLLFADALSAAAGVAGALAGLSARGIPAVSMIALRAMAGALEATGAWLLLERRPAAAAIAKAGVLTAAVYATLGIGLRLAPTNLDPAFRAPVVMAYWAYALVVFGLVRRR